MREADVFRRLHVESLDELFALRNENAALKAKEVAPSARNIDCAHRRVCVSMIFHDECVYNCEQYSVEVAPSASPNSDYATALRIYKEWGDSDDISSHDGFFVWCKKRLNARAQ